MQAAMFISILSVLRNGFIVLSIGVVVACGGGGPEVPQPLGPIEDAVVIPEVVRTVCTASEYSFNGVCLLRVPGNTYFVAVNGDDNNPGTFELPFQSWHKGAKMARPGDMIYIRGGVWQPTNAVRKNGIRAWGMEMFGPGAGSYGGYHSGTQERPIRFFNYPGERPVLDGRLMPPDEFNWNGAIGMSHVQYIHLKGFTIQNVFQALPRGSGDAKPYTEAWGLNCGECANMTYENILIHDVGGRAFQHWSGAWGALEGPDPIFSEDHTTWLNCDAYNLFDRYAVAPGNSADGWKVGTYYGNNGNTYTWKGSRAWNYSDDGFDPHGSGIRIFDNSWAMSTRKYKDLSPDWNIEGNGFKIPAVWPVAIPNYVPGISPPNVIVKQSIAANSVGAGFYNNVGFSPSQSTGAVVVNNFSYKNFNAFGDKMGKSLYANNVGFGSTDLTPFHTIADIAITTRDYTAQNNTWIIDPSGGSWPWYQMNPALPVSSSDYVSLDVNELTRPRKADFSLPDIDFGRLKMGSPLIDGGRVVPGYHCATAGEHPGSNCIVWHGRAPDLGAFESNYPD